MYLRVSRNINNFLVIFFVNVPIISFIKLNIIKSAINFTRDNIKKKVHIFVMQY